ncbi:MAG TPA: prolyl oligopeptidase family serine peptidase [Verrucomicrobiae bacterium]|nr:prolyl oligopeptidase family serine peptidase [Verrucomicrobiae bacterium]
MTHRCAVLLLAAASLAAQPKPTLTPADYGKFEALGAGTLSSDGKWLAYAITRTDGDNELRVGSTAGGGKPYVLAFCTGAAFSSDSRWLACEAGRSDADQQRNTRAGRPNQNSLKILDLSNGNVVSVDEVQSLAFAGEGPYLAFRKYPPAGAGAAGGGRGGNAAPAGGGGGRGARGGRGGGAASDDTERDPTGAAIIVRNLAKGVDTTFGNVTNYAWQDKGSNLAMTIGVEGRVGNAIQIYDPRSGSLKVLDGGPALFSELTWRRDSSDLAALRSIKQDGYEGDSYEVLAWKNLGDKRSTKVDAPKRIVASRTPQWSEDGSILYVGVAEWPKKIVVNRSEEDQPTVEVWHWQDEHVISEQKLTANRDRDKNVPAAWHIASGQLTMLSSNDDEEVRLPRTGNRALALDGTPYANEAMFGRRFDDVYQVNMETGARSQVAKRLIPQVEFSPGGRYAMNFREGDFWIYDLEAGTSKNITHDLTAGATKVVLTNVENDYPVSQKPPYGVAGWTTNDHSVIVYDAYDLWELAPDGSAKPKRLTNGAAEEIRHRYMRLASGGGGRGGRGGGGGRGGAGGGAEWIDLEKPVYMTLEGRWTKKTGYARLENGKEQQLVYTDKRISGLEKAKDSDVFVYERGAWDESPNYFSNGLAFTNARQVSETNPFLSQYGWGKAELVDYKNSHGDRLQGALYYPANYEKGKQYPMIVQIYEIESNQIHNFSPPSERNTYNAAVWSQHGYFVLRPDIVFKPRDPGISALDCVTSAVKKVLESGMIDGKHIGLTGHSWGGYETTFIVTHSDLFAAGAVGGALTNLSSSVGEIYWNSGAPETNHVEVSQERMQVPLYEDPTAYIRNSSTFVANKLAAPLLMEVGDHDGASDWHQDIEFYNAARRAGKPCVMLVYEGENHSVAQKANQIDYHRRINAWFDHYLKGAPAEAWMTKGVTVLERERQLKEAGGPTGITTPSVASPQTNGGGQ